MLLQSYLTLGLSCHSIVQGSELGTAIVLILFCVFVHSATFILVSHTVLTKALAYIWRV